MSCIEGEVKSRIQKEPTPQQQKILVELCRKSMPTFDRLPLEARECWVREYWKEGRESGVSNLSQMFVVAHMQEVTSVELANSDLYKAVCDCVTIVNDEKNKINCVELVEEKLKEYTPLFIEDDYIQVVGEYKLFADSVKGFEEV
jgi:hypothetical protein